MTLRRFYLAARCAGGAHRQYQRCASGENPLARNASVWHGISGAERGARAHVGRRRIEEHQEGAVKEM
jgi:hypothetical protein